ncbi:MAG: hypothetical protein ACE5NL_00100 [Candidatus Hydrothermarchaeaceae archaeon]
MVERGIPSSCRVDPVIPYINENAEELIKELSCIGVKHVVSSTFKPRADSWKRFRAAFRDEAEKTEPLYFKNKYRNTYYLPEEIRYKIMRNTRGLCKKHGMTFAACREGFELNTSPSCDGSHLIPG